MEKIYEFISRLKKMDNPNLNDRKVLSEFGKRLMEKRKPEIEIQNKLQRNSISRMFITVIKTGQK